jgi:NADPH-dependent 2,4-dienoyl-CoA reductase/sulfur reductase-like enzyme
LSGKYKIDVLHDDVVEVDTDKQQVRLASGATVSYDRLMVAPGIDLLYASIPGLQWARNGAQCMGSVRPWPAVTRSDPAVGFARSPYRRRPAVRPAERAR